MFAFMSIHQSEPVGTSESKKSYLPTRKWGVQIVGMAATLATMYVETGAWDKGENIGLIGLVSTAIITYLIPNSPDNTNSP